MIRSGVAELLPAGAYWQMWMPCSAQSPDLAAAGPLEGQWCSAIVPRCRFLPLATCQLGRIRRLLPTVRVAAH